jgi:hypothetical protein
MAVMTGRIWDSIASMVRFCDRCFVTFLVWYLPFVFLLWLAGSGHAGHFLNGTEFVDFTFDAVSWVTKGWR